VAPEAPTRSKVPSLCDESINTLPRDVLGHLADLFTTLLIQTLLGDFKSIRVRLELEVVLLLLL
jgi:hypothetical protein